VGEISRKAFTKKVGAANVCLTCGGERKKIFFFFLVGGGETRFLYEFLDADHKKMKMYHL
jgi:hypothetical protein